ncbi:MAG: hypothetical protein K5872_03945 [Rhizobiaceae bacterium]|nr:hypothetical protein [Rhizobiaceae bacterium]MCV0405363.1 hypothetical protein [Rhizobiaceae bacterium]
MNDPREARAGQARARPVARWRRLPAAFAAMPVVLPAFAQDGFEGGRPIGDWSVYCWASGDCSAELFQSDGGSESNMLVVIRGLRDTGPTIGLLTSMARAQWSAGISFIVDGQEVGRFDENTLCVRDFPPEAFAYAHHLYLTGAQADAVFSAFWSPGPVEVRFEDTRGNAEVAEFKHDGAMSLALGWIERRQGREDEAWLVSSNPETIMDSAFLGALVPSDC